MKTKAFLKIIFLCLSLCALLFLNGCAASAAMTDAELKAAEPEVTPVVFPGDLEVLPDVQTLDLSGLQDADVPAALKCLRELPELQSVELGSDADGLSPKSVASFLDAFPEIDFHYQCKLFGKNTTLEETALDLSDASPAEIRKNLDAISCLRSLRVIRLGSENGDAETDWDLLYDLRKAAPETAKLDYDFTVYGKSANLDDRELDLSYIRVLDDGDAALAAARCMRRLELLNMDSCGVPNERMAEIRDALPDTEVVWRINFAVNYTVLTNATKILASAPSWGGRSIYDGELEFLKYCPKIKYLDVGHNETLKDLSFVRYLPDLEVLIIAMNPLGDLSPLADCENLEYLELFYSYITDLSPLANLKNLKHLNVGHCPQLRDISPIYGLELERFYLGHYQYCPVPAEQVDHYRALHPDCEVDNTSWESSEGAWRRGANLQGEKLEWYKQQPYYREDRITYAPRYALLRDQFGYDTLDYSVKWKDPSWRFVSWFL